MDDRHLYSEELLVQLIVNCVKIMKKAPLEKPGGNRALCICPILAPSWLQSLLALAFSSAETGFGPSEPSDEAGDRTGTGLASPGGGGGAGPWRHPPASWG